MDTISETMPDAGPKVESLTATSGAPELMSALLESFAADGAFIGVYDDHDFLRFANKAFQRAFAVELGTTATFSSIILNAARDGQPVRIEASDPEQFIADAQTRRRVASQGTRQRFFPIDFVDDRWFWCTETLLSDGWIVLTGVDITALKRAEKLISIERDQALLLSGLDELTGIPNRRLTLARLDGYLESQQADTPKVCVALIDLDHFKSINDTFGHETGDIGLRHFAQHCGAAMPKHGFIGRMGGEEFLIVFAGAPCDHLTSTLETLLGSIPPVTSRLPAHVTIELSFSAGVAEAVVGESRVDLLARADNALYQAKRRGRSRVEVHVPDVVKAS